MAISPTAEGFRAAFRRPSLTFAEIMWRWTVGATATAVFLFGLSEYLRTLTVTNGELLFLRTRHPYLIGEAIAHILRGSLNRVVMSGMVAALMLAALWIVAGSVGRMATVRGLLDYFRGNLLRGVPASDTACDGEKVVPGNVSTNEIQALTRLNFLRAAVAIAAVLGFVGAAILAGFASPDSHPRPGLVFLLFLPLAGLICFCWSTLNWFLSLAGIFAVRNGEDAVGALSAAATMCRERSGAVAAVSTWTGLAHLVAFVSASTVVSVPLGLAAVVPGRLVVAGMILVTLAYFALADWLYMVRLAGYVCIAELPEALLRPVPSSSIPSLPYGRIPFAGVPVEDSIDQSELILSDVPSPAASG
jgi:hypothetical protein